jgi:serine/threonine protein kinase
MTQPTQVANVQALVGTTQGNTYTLERLLCESRNSALFEAKQIRLGSRCAVRLLQIDPGQRKPLLAALSQQAQLHHPALLTAVDTMLLSDDKLLIATPLLTGQDLAQRVAGQGKLSLAEGLSVLRELAGALYALHQRGLCHGGISARNVFVASFEDVAVDGALGEERPISGSVCSTRDCIWVAVAVPRLPTIKPRWAS